jgi:hypothetical protein
MIRRVVRSYASVARMVAGLCVLALLLSGCSLFTSSGPPWIEMHPRIHPSGSDIAFLAAYDAATRQEILYGGGSSLLGTVLSQTWTWNGANWTELHPKVSPPPRPGPAMVYDAETRSIVLVTPVVNFEKAIPRSDWTPQHKLVPTLRSKFWETWTWDGTTWSELQARSGLPAYSGLHMAYDAATKSIVLVLHTLRGLETWTWSGSTWTHRDSVRVLPYFEGSAMAYDAATSQVILFEGDNLERGVRTYRYTWTWNGTSWRQRHPRHSPQAPLWSAMTYDPQLQQLLLFGGATSYGPHGHVVNSTWAWNGITWIRLHQSVSPPARAQASMAYDASTKSMVLFGGSGNHHNHSDTWTLRIATHSSRHVSRRSRARGRATTVRP